MPESRVCELTRQLSNAMILHGAPDNARSVERFVPVSLRRRMLLFWQDSFGVLYDEYFDGRAIFEGALWMENSEPYLGMAPERLDELVGIVRQANVLPVRQSDLFLDSLNQMPSPPTVPSLLIRDEQPTSTPPEGG